MIQESAIASSRAWHFAEDATLLEGFLAATAEKTLHHDRTRVDKVALQDVFDGHHHLRRPTDSEEQRRSLNGTPEALDGRLHGQTQADDGAHGERERLARAPRRQCKFELF